jgi:hypothetical protein
MHDSALGSSAMSSFFRRNKIVNADWMDDE